MSSTELVLQQVTSDDFVVNVQFVNEREIRVIRKNKRGRQKEQAYMIDALSLGEGSKRMMRWGWKWFVTAVVFMLITLLSLKFLPPLLGENKNLSLGLILFAGIFGVIGSLVMFWKKTSRRQVFHTLNGKVPIIELHVGRPSKKEFNEFVKAFETMIEDIRSKFQVDEDKLLTGEMRMLRRLSEEGIISSEQYEKAKKKLFSGFDNSAVTERV